MTVTKAQVLEAIDAERAGWEALVAEVGAARMEEPGVAGFWTFKDVAAHLTGWRTRTLDRLDAAVQGKPEPPPQWPAALDTDDEINAWIYEQQRDRSVADVLGDASASFARLREAVAVLPDEALTDPHRFAWMGGEALGASVADRSFFGHLHDEHEPGIRAWLAGGGSS